MRDIIFFRDSFKPQSNLYSVSQCFYKKKKKIGEVGCPRDEKENRAYLKLCKPIKKAYCHDTPKHREQKNNQGVDWAL
jgi:hypothetical protein